MYALWFSHKPFNHFIYGLIVNRNSFCCCCCWFCLCLARWRWPCALHASHARADPNGSWFENMTVLMRQRKNTKNRGICWMKIKQRKKKKLPGKKQHRMAMAAAVVRRHAQLHMHTEHIDCHAQLGKRQTIAKSGKSQLGLCVCAWLAPAKIGERNAHAQSPHIKTRTQIAYTISCEAMAEK